ncbi:glycosyltransferase family 2 protein [Roseisolibacter agri]|uniref:Glycosyltransferase 2-like domain-containing protein n=1 Tax=Roseisolibacter agri TaxID=2014610 RepID=A0AA37Q979_9BACT|nr:glycosyltransferase family 2 protein [Roseisolibacter agri]GLC26042.1 hypothetical protein rosag_25550 [Roseisolibacter agri]
MLYVCIPVHNEATTIGVLLWRIRTVLQEYTREYEVVVYDDGSDDETAEVLEPYRRVLPLTVLRAPRRRGTAAAVDALCRHVVSHTRYPRRDAVVLMQGDFTDRPEDLPELAKRFEGGADLVVGRRPASAEQPAVERRLRQMAPWVLRPFVKVAEVEDLVTGFRLVRVSVLRDLARARGDALLAEGAGWSATVDFTLAVTPYARRVDVVDLPGRYDLRPRASRLDLWRELRELAGYAWRRRGRRVTAGERVGEKGPERPAERGPERMPDREVAVIGSVSALTLAEPGRGARGDEERGGRPARDKRRPERPERPERAERGERPARAERPERPKRETAGAPETEPRKRTKPKRDESARPAEPAVAATGEAAAAAPAAEKPPRPRRERPARPERPPREAAPAAEETSVGADMASEVEEPRVSPVVAAIEAAEDAADEALAAGTRKRSRRRRRKKAGGGAAAAAGETEAFDANGAEPESEAPGSERDDAGEAGGDGGSDEGGDGELEGAEGATEGRARKRSRRRRRGRGRGERAGGEGAGDGAGEGPGGSEGGTEPSSGVAQAATGVGVAAPRAPEPDRAAD